MKKILVPVDFSDVSKNALEYAVRLAAHHQAEVLAVHAWLPTMPEPYLVAAFQEEILENQEALASKLFDDLREGLPQESLEAITLNTQVVLGGPVETILRLSTEEDPDLIIMGTRSSNPIEKKILGSTTVAVVQRLSTPVMVIPEEAEFQAIEKILFASDLLEGDVETIQLLEKTFGNWSPNISCLHVVRDPSIEEDLLIRRLRKLVLETSAEVVISRNHDIEEGILMQADKVSASIVVMRTHNRGFWGRLLHSSYSRDLTRKTWLPLLIYPMQDSEPANISPIVDKEAQTG